MSSESGESCAGQAADAAQLLQESNFADPGDKGKKRSRQKKDPKAPRRPLSAYNVFFKQTRTELNNNVATPGTKVGFTDLVTTIASKWRALDADGRAPFEAQAKADTARYNAEVAMYLAANSSSATVEVRRWRRG